MAQAILQIRHLPTIGTTEVVGGPQDGQQVIYVDFGTIVIENTGQRLPIMAIGLTLDMARQVGEHLGMAIAALERNTFNPECGAEDGDLCP